MQSCFSVDPDLATLPGTLDSVTREKKWGAVTDPREATRHHIFTQLLRARPTSRKLLATRTGLSPATVSRAVEALIAAGLVVETREVISEQRGRRAVLLDVDRSRQAVIGIDIGATTTRIVVADLLGSPLASSRAPTPDAADAGELVTWLSDRIAAHRSDDLPPLAACAVGLPGAVDSLDRSVSNAPNLPQIEEPGFAELLERALGVPTALANDADLALLGEQRFGAARTTPHSAMATIGTGLGAALARDGRILQGRYGLIGEFGQLPAGPFGTPLEHMVTGAGILRRAAESGLALTEPAELFAEPLDTKLAPLRDQFDQALRIVLTAIAVASEPERIVLSGGIGSALGPWLPRYQQAMEASLRIAPQLVLTELDEYAGALGAVVSALHVVYVGLGADPAALGELPVVDAVDPAALVRSLRDGVPVPHPS